MLIFIDILVGILAIVIMWGLSTLMMRLKFPAWSFGVAWTITAIFYNLVIASLSAMIADKYATPVFHVTEVHSIGAVSTRDDLSAFNLVNKLPASFAFPFRSLIIPTVIINHRCQNGEDNTFKNFLKYIHDRSLNKTTPIITKWFR